MDIASVTVFAAQNRGGVREELHGVVRGADDAGTQENAEKPLPAQMIHECARSFVGRERAAARRIAVVPQRTVFAVAGTGIREQRLEHDSISAACQRHRVEPSSLKRAPAPALLRCPAGTCKVILGVLGKNVEFFDCVEHYLIPLFFSG